MALSYMDFTEVGTDNLVQISPKHVVLLKQTDRGIEVHLTTGTYVLVHGKWLNVTQHFKDALAVDVGTSFPGGAKP